VRLTVEEYNAKVLALYAIRAAGNISFPAVVAVMSCIRNRVEKAGDNNWLKAMEDDSDNRDPQFARTLEKAEEIFKIATEIYEGTRTDNLTNDATFWQGGEGRVRAAVVGPNLVLYK
jgi:hypothetical protein